jgi:outer membrane immunogenic protein
VEICRIINVQYQAMKKISTIIMLTLAVAVTLNAQCPLKKGQYQFNAGLGISGWGVPVYAGVDYAAFNDITIGLLASFVSYNEDLYGSKYTSSVFGITMNGNYHFNTVLEIPKKWDFYAGVNIGYYSWAVPSDYPGKNSSGLEFGAQIGGRYFINKQFGLNLELGGSGSFPGGKVGITYTLDR